MFVEKPPALNDERARGRCALRAPSPGGLLAVGFNRRFAPLAAELRDAPRAAEPFELVYRVNAGPLPDDHWLDDPEEGGGRLLGEGCHFVDFACWFAGSAAGARQRVDAAGARDGRSPRRAASPSCSTSAPRGRATIVYVADGAASLGKEYVEAHAGGRSATLHDFRSLELHGAGRTRRRSGGDKGHDAQFTALRRSVAEGGAPGHPDPLDSMAVTFAALKAAMGAGP